MSLPHATHPEYHRIMSSSSHNSYRIFHRRQETPHVRTHNSYLVQCLLYSGTQYPNSTPIAQQARSLIHRSQTPLPTHSPLIHPNKTAHPTASLLPASTPHPNNLASNVLNPSSLCFPTMLIVPNTSPRPLCLCTISFVTFTFSPSWSHNSSRSVYIV